MFNKNLPQAPDRLRKIAEKMDLSQPSRRQVAAQSNESGEKRKPRDFGAAMGLEMRAGADADEAIRLARSKHPELYYAYMAQYRNPEPTRPKTVESQPVKKVGGVIGSGFGNAIKDQLRAGLGVVDAVIAASKADPAAYKTYLAALKEMACV